MSDIGLAVTTNDKITVTSKTTYYLVGMTDVTGMGDIGWDGSLKTTVIRAKCAYL